MNTMDTIIFPDTSVFKKQIYPLLLFCTPLHFLQITETSPHDQESESQPFLDHGLYTPHTPAPLRDDREKILGLVEQIKNRKRQPSVENEDKDSEIALEKLYTLQQESVSELIPDTFDSKLHQAQLTLAIAEILDSEKESLREQLYFLDEDENVALNVLLQQHNSDVQNLADNLNSLKETLYSTSPENAAIRFNAWLRLLKEQKLPPLRLWLASSRAAAEVIFDKYTATGEGPAVPLLKLVIPAHIMESPKYVVQHIETFQRATANIHQGLVADFTQITTTRKYVRGDTESLLPYTTDWASQWEAVLHELFPESSYGRNSITFYLLPNHRVEQLLSLDERNLSRDSMIFHGLLAVQGNA